jgi:hypothetical protein
MKKVWLLICAAALMLCLTACGGDTSAQDDNTATDAQTTEQTEQSTEQAEEQPEDASEETPEPSTEETEETQEPAEETAAEPEFTQVAIGETITLNGVDVELTTGEFLSGDKLGDGISVSTHSDSNKYFWLSGKIVNVGTEPLPGFISDTYVNIIFDDQYTYEGEFMIRNMDGLGPFAESEVYFWADVPPAMLDRYETVKVQFSYNDGFAEYDWQTNHEKTHAGFTNHYEFS